MISFLGITIMTAREKELFRTKSAREGYLIGYGCGIIEERNRLILTSPVEDKTVPADMLQKSVTLMIGGRL